jgi:hypothetical protein
LTGIYLARGPLLSSSGLAAVTNGDSIGSTYRMSRIRSSDRVDTIRLANDAVLTAVADIGLYDINDGTVVSAAFFASAVSLAAASAGTDVTFESGLLGGSVSNGEKRVWEALGLTGDPYKEYDVTLTLTAAATGTGNALLRTVVVSGE